MVRDLVTNIKAEILERVSSPLLSSFLLAWFLWNYRFVMIVLSDGSVIERFALIDETYGSIMECALRAGVYPAMSALLFIVLYPYPARWIYGYWKKRQNELRLVRQELEDETPLTRDELRQFKKGIRETIESYESHLEKQRQEIEKLAANLKQKDEELVQERGRRPGPEAYKYPLDLEADQLDMLQKLAEAGDQGIPIDSLLIGYGQSLVREQYNLDKLEESSYASSGPGERGRVVRIMPRGRAYLIEKALNKR